LAKRFYTVLVLPDATARARKFHISRTAITVVSCIVGVAVLAFAFFIHQYVNLNVRLLELARLQRDVKAHDGVVDRLFQLEKELAQLRDLDGRLRLVAGLTAPAGDGAGGQTTGVGGIQTNVAKALDEKFAGNPTKAEDLVKAVGFNKETDWRFQDLLKSGALYGITSGSGATATVRLEKMGEDIVAPGSSEQRQKALLAAFRNVPEFAAVEAFYKGKKIPEDEFVERLVAEARRIAAERASEGVGARS